MYTPFFKVHRGSVLPSATSDHLLSEKGKERSMSDKVEAAAQAAKRPQAAKRGGAPRLPPHLQTKALEAERARYHRRASVGHHLDNEKFRRNYKKRRAAAGPPLPFLPLTAAQKMATLVEWHKTCKGSQVYPPEDRCSQEYPDWDEEQAEARFLTEAPKSKSRHHDE